NVFQIQQGVAIGIFAKALWSESEIKRGDLYGMQSAKANVLATTTIRQLSTDRIEPAEPAYLFTVQDAELRGEYDKFWPIPSIMNQNGDPAPGIVTTHDEFAVSFSADEAASKIEALCATRNEGEARDLFRLCTQAQWNYSNAKKELRKREWTRQ